ncbi:lantibiotic dehydratase [Spirosoma linguale]|uniref:Lantibiotic dehydratase domain protein n=1 Tax=Spirosoma linguale (strain ATCC 33905 / DSM 74 / LMG 10896 / Claus 1) TaxID=504472 RepID=D2QI69_SPILD|nr:Lantibiotic dehydratase domain protein [Spirosoma linguale DSM 74]
MAIDLANFYLLRVPALAFLSVSTHSEEADAQLKALWEEGTLSEALFVASPSLYQQTIDHLRTTGWPVPPAFRRTLWKYALRMSTRATPFGIMAGCSVGAIAKATEVTFGKELRFVPHHRLDMSCIAQLVRELTNDPLIRPQLRFSPNNSRYIVGDELRYAEHDDNGQERHYFTASVLISTPLEAVLQRAQSGATSAQLAETLVAIGITLDAATTFVDQLIEQQLLISELEPMLTGPPMLIQLQSRLREFTGTDAILEVLTAIGSLLASTNTDACTTHQRVLSTLTRHFSPPLSQHLIQTDLFVNTPVNQLNRRVVQTILRQIEQLLPLHRPRPNAQLVSFAQRFRSRYEDRTIPLLKALDAEFGVGYGDAVGTESDYSSLLDGLSFVAASESNAFTWEAYENLLVATFSRSLREHQLAVELTDDDLHSLGTANAPTLPDSFYLFGNLLGTSSMAVDQGDFKFNLLAAQGPSVANLLGRFCAHSRVLTNHVRACLHREEQQRPDAIFAEIIHLPDDRVGNILQRPVLRRYEIPIVNQASVDESDQLYLNDLHVSVRTNGRISLWSERHQKEVIPRLSTAHNYRFGPSIYQFLADLQHQDSSLNIYWDWGPLREQPFLPRISYRNVILSRARWLLRSVSLPLGSTDALKSHLRTTYQLPRWIAVADGDNELVLDLDTDLGWQLLAEEVRRQPTVHLVEWVATPEQCWLRDDKGAYVNEIVIPCQTLAPSPRHPSPIEQPAFSRLINRQNGADGCPADEQVMRSFDPGSEWLYVKLYSGVQIADELLKKMIFPFVQELLTAGTIQNWFFVRYADPETHLRLRLQCTIPKFYGTILDRLSEWTAPYRKSGVIYRVQIDTYERELDRYGAITITETERLFAADSWAILRYLVQETNSADRWRFAMQSCDSLLADFNVDTREKVNLLRHLQEQFLAEHQADRTLRQQLNARFRSEHDRIAYDLSGHQSTGNSTTSILVERSTLLRPCVRDITSKCPSSSIPDLLASYMHMSLNRLFVSQQRTQEMVIYHFLARYYESQQARR